MRGEHEGRALSDYHIDLFYRDEDDGYVADITDLEACPAFGATAGQALREVEKAKDAWLAAGATPAKPIPEPRYRPAIYSP